jgi:apyrase
VAENCTLLTILSYFCFGTRIKFANNIGDVQAEWALGAFIVHRMENTHHSSAPNFRGCLAPLLLILSLSLFISLFIAKFRRPQTKTIYDLEKGRYIVTRVA